MKRIVVKLGGHSLDSLAPDSPLLGEIAQDIAHVTSAGTDVVLVHGGGPQIEELLETARIESRFHEGLRITDTLTMRYVAMALAYVNIQITAALNHAGLGAVGLCGVDGTLFRAASLGEPWQRAATTPNVRTQIVTTLWANGFCPVVSPVATDESAELVNCNADTAAGALAGALDADLLVLLSDIDQVRDDPDDPGSVLSHMNVVQVKALVESGAARDGMVPKLHAALDALSAGAGRILMANGTRHHALRDALMGAIPTTEIVS